MVGGVNFYQRKEIKDILAYLKTIDNGRDGSWLPAVLSMFRSGESEEPVWERYRRLRRSMILSMYDAFCRAQAVPGLGKAADKILKFTALIEDFRERIRYEDYSIRELIEDVLDESGYQKELEAEGEIEYQTRLENVVELINKAVSFEQGITTRERSLRISGGGCTSFGECGAVWMTRKTG